MQLVGKLRVRLSCIQPNQAVTATLPLLSERKKGAQQVGTAVLTVQVGRERRATGRAGPSGAGPQGQLSTSRPGTDILQGPLPVIEA
jgi:hypothetical protein